MNNKGSSSISTAILLISFLLIATTIASVITSTADIDFSSTDSIDNNEISSEYNTTIETDMEKILDDVLDEITTYIEIKDRMGKFYKIDGQMMIQKIAIMIKPLIIQNIDLSDLTIKISNGKNVKILDYSGNADYIESNPLFEHPIWKRTSCTNFSFIVLKDKDRSLIDYNIINNDMVYIIIQLSEDFVMAKGEILTVTLFPLSGLPRTIILEAPLPMRRVVNFY